VSVDGKAVTKNCFPMLSGCDNKSKHVDFPCVMSSPVVPTGKFKISATISDSVDECPFEGNLLAARSYVTCLIAPKSIIDRLSPAEKARALGLTDLWGKLFPGGLHGNGGGGLNGGGLGGVNAGGGSASGGGVDMDGGVSGGNLKCNLGGMGGGGFGYGYDYFQNLGFNNGEDAFGGANGSYGNGSGTYNLTTSDEALRGGFARTRGEPKWPVLPAVTANRLDDNWWERGGLSAPYEFSYPAPTSVFAPLECSERGCEAFAVLAVNQTPIMDMHDCKLFVQVYQTDYDGELGSDEVIEYIKLNDETLKTNIKPGKNPCSKHTIGDGKTGIGMLAEEDENDRELFTAVEDVDVTNKFQKDGTLTVAAKISNQVDECAVRGNLLYGRVGITCMPSIPRKFIVTPPPTPKSPALKHLLYQAAADATLPELVGYRYSTDAT